MTKTVFVLFSVEGKILSNWRDVNLECSCLPNLLLEISYSLHMGVTNAFQGLLYSIVGCAHKNKCT